MRVLVVGGGGREHALVWKIAQSPLADKIWCAPGNAGIAQQADCVPIAATDVRALVAFAVDNRIDLAVVGPEAPLMAGLADALIVRGVPTVGPCARAARLEGSKVWAKQLMHAAGIPTAPFQACDTHAQAAQHLTDFYAAHSTDTPIVVKADGLAAGKGVVVAGNEAEAHEAVRQIMQERVFGEAGERVVIERCLVGQEASIMAFTDGQTLVPCPPSQDHKRAFDGDQGPNTGGMGAYSPVPILPPNVVAEAVERILRPAVQAMAREGIRYRGVLYAGVMVTDSGLQTIEFNCRLGDPETQTVLPLLQSDIVPFLLGVASGGLHEQTVQWSDQSAVCVVAVSEGYPGPYQTGKPIMGMNTTTQSATCLRFHAGTRLHDGQTVTDGGRVLSVTGLGHTLAHAQQTAYEGLQAIHFDGMRYRQDIAARSLTSSK